MNQRGILDRFFSMCLGFFVACLLLYFGVQLVRAVLGWLIVALAIFAAGGLFFAAMRARRERW
jgi:hypothetical protein